MDRITKLIRDEIKRQYRNLRRFSEESGIPYSTLSNALARGIGNTAYDTVVKVCRLLGIRQVYDEDVIVFNDRFKDICEMLSELDEKGVHTVQTVLKMEYDRCRAENADNGHNGIVFEREHIDQ